MSGGGFVKTTRRAFFMLNPELLRQALHMPESSTIIGAEWDFTSENLKVYVQDDAFRAIQAGELTPMLIPMIKTEDCKTYTWDWNI